MKHHRLSSVAAVAASILLFAGCSGPAPQEEDIVGVWRYESQGDGPVNNVEVSTGEIVFMRGGRFSARNVSGIVVKMTDGELHSENGSWSLPKERGVSRYFDRHHVTLTLDRHGIPFNAYYEGSGGRVTLTFARDEASGRWVRYAPKEAADAPR